MVRKTGSDIIQFGYKFVDEVGKETTDCGMTRKGGNGNNRLIVDKDNNSFSYKALTTCYSLWSRAFKRSLFDTEEGFYRDYYDVNMTNDLLAFSRPLSLAKSYCFTDFYTYNYRILESSLCHDVSTRKICSYFKSIGWAEKCLRTRNGTTYEHVNFFSMRLVNIVFDEYREKIYSSRIQDIKKIYESSGNVEGLNDYLEKAYKNEEDWYKKAFIKSFVKRRIIIPKLLMVYINIRNNM